VPKPSRADVQAWRAGLDSIRDTRAAFPAPFYLGLIVTRGERGWGSPALPPGLCPSSTASRYEQPSLYERSRYMGASVRVLEMHYAHLVGDAEETARAKLGAHAASV
jgi:hypothetical protein